MEKCRNLLFQALLVILALVFTLGLYFYRSRVCSNAGAFGGGASSDNLLLSDAFYVIGGGQ